MEYRLPTLAMALGLHLVENERLRAWRPANVHGRPTRRQRFLNGVEHPVRLPTILMELARPNGAHAFHPSARTVARHSDMAGRSTTP